MSERWVLVPVEPDFGMMDAGNRAARGVRVAGVGGMTVDAQTRAECAREIAAWPAMLAARPPVSREWLDAAVKRTATVMYERNPDWYGNAFGAIGDARAAILAALEMTDEP